MSTTTRNFSPWAYWMHHLETVQTTDGFTPGTPEEYAQWRERALGRLRTLVGPTPTPVPLNVEVLSSEDCGTYRRDKVVFDTEEMMSVPAYLLVPHGRSAPGPAVLAVHGHSAGKTQICGLVDDGISGDYAHQLALRGYVVLAPDLRCWGERADPMPGDHYHCDTNLVHAVMAGVMPLSQNLWDLARCLDVLEQHPLVDATRIGVCGFSYGATLTLFLTALDQRVRVAVVASFLTSWATSHAVALNMCGSQVFTGMLGQIEHLDLAALIYPRPLFVESAIDDPMYPAAVAQETVAALRPLYDQGPEGALVQAILEGGHHWSGEQVYPFIERWLPVGS